jgi:hypothetical protein
MFKNVIIGEAKEIIEEKDFFLHFLTTPSNRSLAFFLFFFFFSFLLVSWIASRAFVRVACMYLISHDELYGAVLLKQRCCAFNTKEKMRCLRWLRPEHGVKSILTLNLNELS